MESRWSARRRGRLFARAHAGIVSAVQCAAGESQWHDDGADQRVDATVSAGAGHRHRECQCPVHSRVAARKPGQDQRRGLAASVLPDLAVREESLDEGFKYTGFANLSAGLTGEYLYGHFTSGEFLVSPSYHQTSVDFAADYTLSGLSVFRCAVGYSSARSRRSPAFQDSSPAIVRASRVCSGSQRDLTGKTSTNFKLSRAINIYITAASARSRHGRQNWMPNGMRPTRSACSWATSISIAISARRTS